MTNSTKPQQFIYYGYSVRVEPTLTASPEWKVTIEKDNKPYISFLEVTAPKAIREAKETINVWRDSGLD